MPSICYVTKTYIKDIPSKEWPEIDANEFLEKEVDEEFKPIYIAHNMNEADKIIPSPKSSEDTIFEKEDHDINPLIYFRLSRKLKEKAQLPFLTLNKYFEVTENHGLKIEVTPDFSYEKNKYLIQLHKVKHNKTVKSIKRFNEKLDRELLEAIETYLSKTGVNFFDNPSTQVNATDCEFISKELKSLPAKEIQGRLNAFLSFNENFTKVIPFVLLDEEIIKEVTDGQ